MQGSVAFPEIIFPSIITLKRALKKSYSPGKHNGNSKIVTMVKVFLERVEEAVKWVSRQRDNVVFAPANQVEVEKWERGLNIGDSPIGKYMRVQRKAREKKQALLSKVSSMPNVMGVCILTECLIIKRRATATMKFLKRTSHMLVHLLRRP